MSFPEHDLARLIAEYTWMMPFEFDAVDQCEFAKVTPQQISFVMFSIPWQYFVSKWSLAQMPLSWAVRVEENGHCKMGICHKPHKFETAFVTTFHIPEKSSIQWQMRVYNDGIALYYFVFTGKARSKIGSIYVPKAEFGDLGDYYVVIAGGYEPQNFTIVEPISMHANLALDPEMFLYPIWHGNSRLSSNVEF
jgi:hypothetical protein